MLVAQRLKRITSIEDKLGRFQSMRLTQMQDIGGCRAIVGTDSAVLRVMEGCIASRSQHECVNCKDYISAPKPDGYRGVHLVHRYHSDNRPEYNGLLIETQIRSRPQHAWAMAVETVGLFLKQGLKFGRGDHSWLDFFKLMGTAIAVQERAPPVPGTPSEAKELRRELKAVSDALGARKWLQAWSAALRPDVIEHVTKAHTYLLEIDVATRRVSFQPFRARDLGKANDRYAEAEKRLAGRIDAQVVLVSVDRATALRRAYPSFFLDMDGFLKLYDKAMAAT